MNSKRVREQLLQRTWRPRGKRGIAVEDTNTRKVREELLQRTWRPRGEGKGYCRQHGDQEGKGKDTVEGLETKRGRERLL